MEDLFSRLDQHWNELGFFGSLRVRELKFDLGQEVLAILSKVDFAEIDHIPKKYVRLLWFIPLFMEWQGQRLPEYAEKSVIHEYTVLQNGISTEIERILGVP
ncbi:hypothetical protein GO730_10495 [Spirosoma sp. HMF3257]|uniref:Uncharacterized protein n=1 Tax=Spirosoma telluris TaxID=2183553 RepID=A0A327NGZ3_9BACT|nr:hypothetical protein [Spirosoma telluris]RAI74582.1 hypothetical protein HMF3257_10415 [Spirosoma telluris]